MAEESGTPQPVAVEPVPFYQGTDSVSQATITVPPAQPNGAAASSVQEGANPPVTVVPNGTMMVQQTVLPKKLPTPRMTPRSQTAAAAAAAAVTNGGGEGTSTAPIERSSDGEGGQKHKGDPNWLGTGKLLPTPRAKEKADALAVREAVGTMLPKELSKSIQYYSGIVSLQVVGGTNFEPGQDYYTKVTMKSSSEERSWKTPVIKNSDKTPVWEYEMNIPIRGDSVKGQTSIYKKDATATVNSTVNTRVSGIKTVDEVTISVEVWDWDRFSTDDFIGHVALTLANFEYKKVKKMKVNIIANPKSILNSSKIKGSLLMTGFFIPDTLLYIMVMQAKDMKKSMVGKNDPYVTVAWRDKKFRTPTHNRGGRTPVWNHEIIIPLNLLEDAHEPTQILKFTVMDEDDLSRDDFLASLDLPIKELYTLKAQDKYFKFTKGKGSIRLCSKFVPPDGEISKNLDQKDKKK